MKQEADSLEPRAAYALWARDYPAYAHNPLMMAEERAMLSLLPAALAGLNVLDAGCGSGRYSRHALARQAEFVAGVDLSTEMLRLCAAPGAPPPEVATTGGAAFVQGSVAALPIASGWADVTLCGLTLGHLQDLRAPLLELCRVTRSGGLVLCSDFHPLGATLGWRREFKVDGTRYAVRHTTHGLTAWREACKHAGLHICRVLEPYLSPADIPAGAHFDQRALEIPVAVVYELRA